MSVSNFSFDRAVFLGVAVVAATALLIALGTASAARGGAGSQTQSASTWTYEVVSIRPSKSNGPSGGNGLVGNGIRYTDNEMRANTTVMSMIEWAYGVDADRISGGQGWVSSDKFTIEAKMESLAADEMKKLSPDDRELAQQRMLQTLLADRFKLTIRTESKQLPVYELVIAKSGLRIREATPGDTYADGIKGGNGKGLGGDLMVGFGSAGTVRAQGIEIGTFVQGLSRYLKRPVVDKTGLSGRYDFQLHYVAESRAEAPSGGTAVDAAADPAGPSLFTAIQEQLGLKLEAKKDPLATIVIEHVERPSGN